MWDIEQKSVRIGLIVTFTVVLLTALIPLSLSRNFVALSPTGFLMYGLSLLYFVNGSLGFAMAVRHPRWLWAYFVSESLIVGILFYHYGFFWIFMMPLTCHAVTTLRPIVATVQVLSLLLFSTLVAWGSGLSAMMSNVLSIGSALSFTAFTSVLLLKFDLARKKAESLSKEIASANEKLRDNALNIEKLAVAQERNRMAREIHDGLGHYLTVINVQIEAARALMAAGQPGAEASLAKAEQLSRDALADVRRSVGQLKTDSPFPSLQEAIARAAENSGLPVQFRIKGTPRPLNSSIEHALLRTAQEGLTNIRKHAGAQNAEILLDYRSDSHVELTLSDDGHGCQSGNQTGHGLDGLRERIELLSGRFHSANREPKGFVLRVEVPA